MMRVQGEGEHMSYVTRGQIMAAKLLVKRELEGKCTIVLTDRVYRLAALGDELEVSGKGCFSLPIRKELLDDVESDRGFLQRCFAFLCLWCYIDGEHSRRAMHHTPRTPLKDSF